MKNTSLYSSLFDLSRIIFDKIRDYKNQGKLIKIPYRHLPVKEIDFDLDTFHYDWERIKYFDYFEWKSIDFINFQDEIKTLKELDISAREIANEYKIDAEVVKKFGLSRFINLLMNHVPNGKITYENVEHYIERFIREYENQPKINWEVSLWLRNIFIESNEIEIFSKVFLRRPQKEQLADISIRSYHTKEFDMMTGRVLPAGAILSFSIQTDRKAKYKNYPEKILGEIECWLNALRLFKPGSIIPVYITATPCSLFENEVFENVESPFEKLWKGKIEYKHISNYQLYLRKNDENLLKEFINEILPTLRGISHKTYLTGNAHDLSLHRYSDSLIKSELNAYRILSAITSLEALLSDGSAEVTFKIALRAAKLISYFGLNSDNGLSKLKIAYSLRSKLVHGSKLKIEGKNERVKIDLLEWARKHTHEIINFNRVCLLTALLLKNEIGKMDLIKMIDRSFVNPVEDQKLKGKIRSKVKIPIIDPYTRNNNLLQ